MFQTTLKKHQKTPPDNPVKKQIKVDTPTSTKVLDFEYDSDDTNKFTPKPPTNDENRHTVTLRLTFRAHQHVENPHVQHINFLQNLFDVLSPNPTIYNKRHEIIKESVLPSLEDTIFYDNHFEMHSINIPNQDTSLFTFIQEVRSIYTYEELKRHPEIFTYLREQKVQMYQHDWLPNDWNVRAVGFMPKLSPSHHSKEIVQKLLNENLKSINEMPLYRVRTMFLNTKINNTRLRVRVYAIEVKSTDYNLANKLLMKHFSYPEEYIPFRLRGKSEEAYNNSIAKAAQFQDELRSITIQNVSPEAFFILDNELEQLAMINVHFHTPELNTIRIVVNKRDYNTVQQAIKENINRWSNALDPSDIRKTGLPELQYHYQEDPSETSSQLSSGIASLLTIDFTEYTIFPQQTTPVFAKEKPISEVTMTDSDERYFKQQEVIETQGKRIEDLLLMVQTLQEVQEKKFESLMRMVKDISNRSTSSKESALNDKKANNAASSTKRRP